MLNKLEPKRVKVIPYFEKFKLEIESIIAKKFKNPDFLVPKTYIEALKLIVSSEEENKKLTEENILLKIENDDLKNKAELYNMMLSSTGFQDMKEISSVFGIGRNKLFGLLREKHIFIDGGFEHNLPYQKYIGSGYFVVRKVIINRTLGKDLKNQTLVTPKGLSFIGKIFKSNKEYFIQNM